MPRSLFSPLSAAVLLLIVVLPVLAAADGPVRFLTGPQSGEPHELAMSYLERHLGELGLSPTDLADFVVQDSYRTEHNGVSHLYLQQRLDGINVFNGVISINVAKNGSIINLHSSFVGDLAATVNSRGAVVADRNAIARAAAHYGIAGSEDRLELLEVLGTSDFAARYSDSMLSRGEIPINLVYQPLQDGSVRLAWNMVFDLPDRGEMWTTRVDAVTGEILNENTWTNYDSYLVIPFPPFTDPDDSGGQVLVVDPADPIASAFGWHDTDGITGREFTDTQGNNVDAHDDLDGNNSGGTRPDGDMGGAMLEFTFPFDPALGPQGGTNLEAAIVNLFYANNVMHDLTYQYGFDEPAGNFQLNTYGNGGAGNDHVEADAQDNALGSPPSTNNANFSTPPDGLSGRMQMFVWTYPFSQLVTVNPPSTIEDSYIANPSNSGGTGNGLTADLAIVDDGVAPTTDGCQTITNDLTGKTGLIVWNQGACNSSVFVANAANAGAVAAIIVDNNETPTTNFGGSGSIPSVAVGLTDGNLFISTITGGETVNATLEDNSEGMENRDSDNDNGIIAHEYGHGISNRLTGGPGNVNCLNGAEQAGEGWSDFWTLVMSAKSSDTPEFEKGVGNYVIFEPLNGPGIRNFPYTTNLVANPQTYADIATTNAPHGVGEIWMDMVWEMYWELVTKHGFDSNYYTGTGGNNLTMQLVVDGMKMQPCSPTFVTARDAILAADLANNGGENVCEIWRAFAKRGLGTEAIAGGTGVGDETENFDIPGSCPALAPTLFTDGFESGDTARWSNTLG